MEKYNTDTDPVQALFASYRYEVKNPELVMLNMAQDKLFDELVKHIAD